MVYNLNQYPSINQTKLRTTMQTNPMGVGTPMQKGSNGKRNRETKGNHPNNWACLKGN